MLNFQIYTTFAAAKYTRQWSHTHTEDSEKFYPRRKNKIFLAGQRKIFLLTLNHFRLYNRTIGECKKKKKNNKEKKHTHTHTPYMIINNVSKIRNRSKYILSSPRTVASVEKRFVISLVDRDILVRSNPFYSFF